MALPREAALVRPTLPGANRPAGGGLLQARAVAVEPRPDALWYVPSFLWMVRIYVQSNSNLERILPTFFLTFFLMFS